MAATIAHGQDSSAIADTMPTAEMPSGDATDGVNTAAVCDALPRLQSAQNPVNSGTADESVAVDAVFGPHLRGSSRARNRPPTYSEKTAPL